MSRPFDRRRPSDLDRWITLGLLLILAAVLLGCVLASWPKFRLLRAHRAEWERCQKLVAELQSRRPDGMPADVWDQRCGWIQTAHANVFGGGPSWDRVEQGRWVNDQFERLVRAEATAATPDTVWAFVVQSGDRGRRYMRQFFSLYVPDSMRLTEAGAFCGGIGQQVLLYGQP